MNSSVNQFVFGQDDKLDKKWYDICSLNRNKNMDAQVSPFCAIFVYILYVLLFILKTTIPLVIENMFIEFLTSRAFKITPSESKSEF